MPPARYEKKYPEQTKLKQIMYDRGITQAELAEYLVIAQSSVNMKNNGVTEWTISQVHQIIKFFNLPFEELF